MSDNNEKGCKCQKPASSIHGKCNTCGKKMRQQYNIASQEPQLPTTTRGHRRRASKKKG
jgi:hypothetical protein